MPTFRIREAARLLGVSTDTVRRWADRGRIATTTEAYGRLVIDGAALARAAEELASGAITGPARRSSPTRRAAHSTARSLASSATP